MRPWNPAAAIAILLWLLGPALPARAQVPPPILEPPFEPGACDALAFGTLPESVTIEPSAASGAASVRFDLRLYEYALPRGTGALLQATDGHPEEGAGAGTTMALGPVVFRENVHYDLWLRRWVGTEVSDWMRCGFWIDAVDDPHGPPAILSPASGTLFPAETTGVSIFVRRPEDPEAGIPGRELSLALCASLQAELGDCDPDPTAWQLAPMAAEVSEIVISRLTDGAELSPGLTVFVEVLGLDEREVAGASVRIEFLLSAESIDCFGQSCAPWEACNPASETCVDAGSCELGCAPDELCEEGTCVPDLCFGVHCDPGGQCHPPTGTCEYAIVDCFGCPCCSAVCPTREGGWVAGLLVLALGLTRARKRQAS